MVDGRNFALGDKDLNDIETPRQITRAKALEPLVRPSLDEKLFLFVHGIEWPDLGIRAACFHFDE